MSRFPVIVCGVLGLVLAAAGTRVARALETERPKLTRETVLKEISANVVAPAYLELETRCLALSSAVNALVEKPDAGTLRSASESWREAYLSAQRISCFKLGPVADGGHVPAFYFCPIRPASIERFVSGKVPVTTEKVEELGAAAKGLCAIEYLLNGPSAESALEKLKGGERRRGYLKLLAEDVAKRAAQLAKEWKPPIGASAERFVQGRQESINSLVNQLAWSVENLNERRVRPVIEPTKDAEPNNVNGQLIARMHGVRRILCAENGLADLLEQLGSPAAGRLKEQTERAIEKLGDLETADADSRREKATAAYEACRQVELLIKVDTASALGVTLTFSPIDGD